MGEDDNNWKGYDGDDMEAPNLRITVRSAANDAVWGKMLAKAVGEEWRKAPGRVTPLLRALLDQMADLYTDAP